MNLHQFLLERLGWNIYWALFGKRRVDQIWREMTPGQRAEIAWLLRGNRKEN